jgi:hypothetical protein
VKQQGAIDAELFLLDFFLHDLNDLHDGREKETKDLTFVHDREERVVAGEHAHVVMSDILRYPLVVLSYNVCPFSAMDCLFV